MIQFLRVNRSIRSLESQNWISASARIFQKARASDNAVATGSKSNLPPNLGETAFETTSETTSETAPNENTFEKLTQAPAESNDDISIPWYLRDDIKSTLIEEKEVTLPPVPSYAPQHVLEFLKLLATDYGMENLLLFDMTTLDESHEFKANNMNVDFIIISTGKSERHILKASTEFRTYIKHKYNVLPATEGIVSTAKTPAMRRKLLRRARKGPSSTDNEYGRSANSWVLFHHDNVDVHIMTAERRQDLNLESIWCRPEDLHLYEHKPVASVESDYIFSGIRRFHTLAGRRQYSSMEDTRHHLKTLLAQPKNISKNTLAELKLGFDKDFLASSPKDFDSKYKFYKILHMMDPEVVAFEQAEAALLEKYASSEYASEDFSMEKINDVTEFTKLLLDSPIKHVTIRDSADSALDRLSRFISVLYLFSPETFSMSRNPEFIPLLWKLTHWESLRPVSPADVDNFVATPASKRPFQNGNLLVKMASNDARNVLTLIEFHKKAAGPDISVTAAFKELVLFTYGNAGKWDEFWVQWDALYFPDVPPPEAALEQWVRLVVFLLLVGNQSQMLRFFDHYWKNGSSVSGTFLGCLQENNGQFSSENQKRAFVEAMRIMVDSLDPNGEVFDKVRLQLSKMEGKSGNE